MKRKKTIHTFFLIIIFFLGFSISCSNNSSNISVNNKQKEYEKNSSSDWKPVAIALQGAVITDVTKNHVTYQQKCERCGALGSRVLTGFFIGVHNSSFICHKCKKRQKIVIKCMKRK